MTATRKVSRSRKRPARTPPSTFLFLPIHFSNSPEPRGSVVQYPTPASTGGAEAHTSDAATRTWPRDHGRMLGHRVNSEGLRRRTIALGGGAPKSVYIVFGSRDCQPSDMRKKPCGSRESGNFCPFSPAAGASRTEARDALGGASIWPSQFGFFSRLAPYCGHIPPSFFRQSYRDVATRGTRQNHLSFAPRRNRVVLTVRRLPGHRLRVRYPARDRECRDVVGDAVSGR